MAMTFQNASSRELPQQRPSKLQLLQADYQHKLLKEKEEKLIKISENEEQKNSQRLRRVVNYDRNDSAPQNGSSRHVPEHRRTEQPLSAGSGHEDARVSFHPTIHKRTAVQRYGYDKSNPLAPIEGHQESAGGRPVLRKQGSLSRVPLNPVLQEDHRGAYSDSDLHNPRTDGSTYPSQGTYKLSDFQKWQLEQDEKRKPSQKARGGAGTAKGSLPEPNDTVNGRHRGNQFEAAARGVDNTRLGAHAADGGLALKKNEASRSIPVVTQATVRAHGSKTVNAVPKVDSYDADEDVDEEQAERQAMIERLEAEHARKLKELEALRQRQTVKDTQKRRLVHVGQQFSRSADDDSYDEDYEEADSSRTIQQQQQHKQQPVVHIATHSTAPKDVQQQAKPGLDLVGKQRLIAASIPHHQQEKHVVDESGEEIIMAQCPICERTFAEERLQKHMTICEKTASKQRKVFDATKQRLAGSGAEKYIGRPKRRDTSNRPKKDWRKQHEDFISTIRYAKRVTELEKTGGDVSSLPPPPPTHNPDYVQCQYCRRSFDPHVAERHVPKCKDIKSRPAAPQQRRK